MDYSIYSMEHIALSRRAAAEGIVLLKNENSALPLSKEKPVALFGILTQNQNLNSLSINPLKTQILTS